jgi:peptidoglycan lytic transglycosylase D
MSSTLMSARRTRAIVGVFATLLAISACGGPGHGGGGGVGVLRPTKRARGTAPPKETPDSVTARAVRAARDSAADQALLDSLHKPKPPGSDTILATPPVAPKKEEVAREAVRLFGLDEGRAVVGAVEPTFDIDVTSFAANRRVLEYLEFFQVDARDRFAIWLTRLGRYEGMIRERLRAKRLPEDLVYLTLVESGLSNTAVSRARAVGMWQFMASTARMYGLTVDPWVDERRDPFRATEAAVNHLADLRERLGGSAYLAAAAYNAGVGRVTRGMKRLPGEQDSVSDYTFFQLADRRYLRRETRDYVPKLIAASLVAKQPGRYGFDDIRLLSPLMFDEISIPDATGLDVLARLADTTVDAMIELNPQFVRGITPPGRTVTVRVPRGRGTLLAGRYDTLPVTDRITFVDHYVSRGQTLSEIAHRYKVTLTMLHSANPRLKRQSLRVGQRIIVPMSGRVVPAAAWSVPPEPRGRRIRRGDLRRGKRAGARGDAHRVELGDTMSEIARRYAVSLSELLDYNDLSMKSLIRAGDWVRIPRR